MANQNFPPRTTEIAGQPHLLSYITPKEAGILKLLGGAGKAGPMGINEKGLDEFIRKYLQ